MEAAYIIYSRHNAIRTSSLSLASEARWINIQNLRIRPIWHLTLYAIFLFKLKPKLHMSSLRYLESMLYDVFVIEASTE